MDKKMITTVLVVSSVSLTQAAIYTYDVSTEIGASGTLLTTNQDNWTGDDEANWRAQDQSGTVYLRNHNGGDNTLTRNNDANFGFTIDPSATMLSLTMTARIDTFWQAGISNSANGKIIGIGGDFNNSNDFFSFVGARTSTDNNLATTAAGNIITLSLVLDLNASTYDLTYDPSGANTVLQNDIDYSGSLSSADILGMNQLYTRSGNQFAGAATWTIETTVIPEPSSAALLGLGSLALVLRRRR